MSESFLNDNQLTECDERKITPQSLVKSSMLCNRAVCYIWRIITLLFRCSSLQHFKRYRKVADPRVFRMIFAVTSAMQIQQKTNEPQERWRI
jgi:hypothetical protein